MKLTDKNTITSKYEPKSKNVTWVDMSTGSPVMKKFINGMWRPVGSGGGNSGGGSSCNCNLPEPSQLNNGQVLSVGHGEPTGLTTILDTTSLSLLETLDHTIYKISNAYNPDVFYEGREICAIVDGNTLYSTILQSQEFDGMLCATFDVNGGLMMIAHPSGDSNLYIEFSEPIPLEEEEFLLFDLYCNEYNYEYMLADAANVLCPTDVVYNGQYGEYYARFKNLPEAGKAYYIPYLFENKFNNTEMPIMLPCYILSIYEFEGIAEGKCVQLFCPEYHPLILDKLLEGFGLFLNKNINNSIGNSSTNIYLNILGVREEESDFTGYHISLERCDGDIG